MSKKKKKDKKDKALSYTVRTNIAIPNKYGYMECPVEESDFIDSLDIANLYCENIYHTFIHTGCGVFRGALIGTEIREFTPKERKYRENHRKELNI